LYGTAEFGKVQVNNMESLPASHNITRKFVF